MGIGLLSNSRRPLSRSLSIHSGSFFLRRDVAHDLFGQAAARVGAGGVGVGPAVLVAAEAVELGVVPWWSCGLPSWRVSWCWSGARRVPAARRAGRGWCRRGRRGRAWPGAGRARRAAGRTRRSRPRRAGGTPARRAARGSGPGTTARRAGYAGRGRADRRGVAVDGEALGQGLRARPTASRRRPRRAGVAALELTDALLGERADGVVAEAGPQVAQRGRGEVVVPGGHRRVAAVGGDVAPGGPAAAAAGRSGDCQTATRPSAARASRCRRTAAGVEPEPAGQHAGADGPGLEHRPADTVAGPRVRRLTGTRRRGQRGHRHGRRRRRHRARPHRFSYHHCVVIRPATQLKDGERRDTRGRERPAEDGACGQARGRGVDQAPASSR